MDAVFAVDVSVVGINISQYKSENILLPWKWHNRRRNQHQNT